jgi:transposase-like protein
MMCCSAAITRAVHKRGIATATAAASSTPRKAASDTAARKVRDTGAPFRSQIREAIGGRTEELERLAIELYARGLSVRDIEAAFVDDNGKSLLSKTAVSEIAERLWADYQTFAAMRFNCGRSP